MTGASGKPSVFYKRLITSILTQSSTNGSENSASRYPRMFNETYSEAVTATIQPEPHHVVGGLSNLHVIPVQVWLFCQVEVEVVFVRRFIVIPGRTFGKGRSVRMTVSQLTSANQMACV